MENIFVGFEPELNEVTNVVEWHGRATVVAIDNEIVERTAKDNSVKRYRRMTISLRNFAGETVLSPCNTPVKDTVTEPKLGQVIDVRYSYRNGRTDFNRSFPKGSSSRLTENDMRQDLANQHFAERLKALAVEVTSPASE